MWVKTILPALLAVFAVSILEGGDARALECDERNPDYCDTCEDVRRAYSGQDVNLVHVRGRSVWTPLYSAYFRDCPELAQSYLSRGARPQVGGMHVRGRSVWTPLYSAYFRDCPELAQSYLSRGARPQVGGMEGDMLATVISWDRWEIPQREQWVRMLINAGARLDEPPITQRTTRERLMQEYGHRQDVLQLISIAEQAGG